MTSILARPPELHSGAASSPLISLESAVSPDTYAVAWQIQALRNPPSCASIRPGTGQQGSDKPLPERLFEALAAAKILTSQIAMHLDAAWRARLFDQLDSLHDPEEWGIGDLPVRQASFSTFLKALLLIGPERGPGLGLSVAGNIVAAWTTGKDRLTIEFLPDDRIRWVLSVHHDDGTARYAGDTPVSCLKEDLARHQPERWFSRVPNQSCERTR